LSVSEGQQLALSALVISSNVARGRSPDIVEVEAISKEVASEMRADSLANPMSLRIDNYPNPFNPTTQIRYRVPVRGNVSVRIYDVKGARIVTLLDEVRPVGNYSTVWNGQDGHGRQVPSGLYFCRLQAGALTEWNAIIFEK